MTPIWTPSAARRENASLTAFARSDAATQGFAASFDYAGLHRWSIEHRAEFWSRVWDFCGVIGDKGARVLRDDERMPGSRWFPEARLNYAENLLRERSPDAPALVFRDGRARRQLRFDELKRDVASLAAHLRALGLGAGDTVAAYTHNCPQTVTAMLAAASIGAVFASCSADFGVAGVLSRFSQIAPKALFVSDGYYYKDQTIDRLQNAREIAAALPGLRETIVIPYVSRTPDVSGFAASRLWPDVLAAHDGAELSFPRLPFDHPLYVMFSSGTTGAPKCILHGAGGTLLQHLKEHRLHCDLRAADRVFYATTTGWMMWNWLVSALASEATVLLYDGFFLERDGKALFDLAEEERAALFGVSSGFLKAVEKLGLTPRKTHDLSSLRLVAATGSPLPPESFDYVYRAIKSDVHLASISGGTDIISCFVLGNPWQAVQRGEIQGAGLGMSVEVWDKAGRRIWGEQGELVCTRSFPSMPLGFLNDPEGAKYRDAYFSSYPGVWRHGDYATQTQSGGFIIHGRSDATLNPQGVRIGTADIYNVVESMREIEEALAVEQQTDEGGRILLFVKMAAGCTLSPALTAAVKKKLRAELSPRHVPAAVIAAPELPHTRSGKLSEIAVKDVIHGRPVQNVEALANPQSLCFFADLALDRM